MTRRCHPMLAVRTTLIRAMPMLLVAVLSGATISCSGRTPVRDPTGANVRDTRVDIRVINNNFSDATLFANLRGRREFLGRLTGKTEANYTFNLEVAQPITIDISLLAGGTCTTRELIVDPGDELFLTIESALDAMQLCNRRG